MKNKLFIVLFLLVIPYDVSARREKSLCPNKFSECLSLIVPKTIQGLRDHPELTVLGTNTIIWNKKSPIPYSQLILSWNASRPKEGKFSFFVNVKHHEWSGWKKIAEWGKNTQKSYENMRDRYVHVKYVRVELAHRRLGYDFQIKVVAENGAELRRLKAVFVNVANERDFRTHRSHITLPSFCINGLERQSQWRLNHPRTKDLCSPTSLSMVTRHFAKKYDISPINYNPLGQQTVTFAKNVRDQGFDIYGNWMFNVAQAFNETRGKLYFRVEKLNDFGELYAHLVEGRPVAVSIRGYLRGGAWPYRNGHFIVVVGWDQKTQRVICLDPAFRNKREMVRFYRLRDFDRAWGASKYLSYIPIPRKVA